MIIIFLFSGILIGSAAAALTVWSGGSMLLGAVAYSIIGTVGALGVLFLIYAIQEASSREPEWDDEADEVTDPVSI